MIGDYYAWLAMIIIGILAIICWCLAWDSRVPTRSRWTWLLYGIILMGFELCIISVDVRFQ